MGLKVSFGRHVRECNAHLTASIEHRLEDLHAAVADPAVKAILAVTGGVGAIQMLDSIDYKLFAKNPKIICGYSDIAYFCNAILARACVATYYGPNFTSFMMRQGAEYTLDGFRQCLFEASPMELRASSHWSEDAWHKGQEHRTFHSNAGCWCVQPGEAVGTIVGGNWWVLNMLQGSKFFPALRDTILFLEHPTEGKATLMSLDSGLRALSFQHDFAGVRGIVIGRFGQNGGVTRENLTELCRQIPSLHGLPVMANCDFGHTTPVATLPIGGQCKIIASESQNRIILTEH